jgi:hypothetical protein
MAERHTHLPVSESLPMAPGDVFRDAPAFFLRQGTHDGDEEFPIERLFDTITFCTLKGRFCTLQGALLIDSAPKAEKERLLRHLEETLNLQITWSVVIIDKNHRRPLIQSMSYKYSSRFQ